MKKINYLLLFALMLLIQGCNDILDILPDDKPELEDAFINEYNTEKYLFTCYSYIPPYASPTSTLGISGGGEIVYHEQDRQSSMPNGRPNTMKAFFDANNAADPYMNFWDNANGSPVDLWAGIRHCNTFLEMVPLENGGPKDLSADLRNQWMAEVRMLRAYFHFYLFRLYGPIPIMDRVIPISATGSELQVYRNTVDEVVSFIVSEIDKAIIDLPNREDMDPSTEYGRFNKTIAKAIKAKVLVLAASPLFNNNNYYKEFKDRRGVDLFPEGDSKQRWEAALQACDEACRAAEEDGGSILVTTDGGNFAITDVHMGNINDTIKALVSLRQAVTESWNSEVIWGKNETYNTALLQQYSTMLSDAEWSNSNGSAGTSLGQRQAPTINFIEMFYSSNGLPIEEDEEWQNKGWYENRYTYQLPDAKHSKYFIKSGQASALLHFHRSLRFYASVGFDGGLWEGRLKTLVNSSYASFLSGKGCGEKTYGNYGGFSVTGYLAKKLSHLKTNYAATKITLTTENYIFPVIRLADMYLLLAECLNEVDGPSKMDSKGRNAYSYLDEIRARSGMEGVVKSYREHAKDQLKNKPTSQEGLRQIIRRERINELAFEGSFYYDMRRWLMAEDYYNKSMLGWNYKGATKGEFYSLALVAQPKFTMRDYLMPIKTSTLLQNKNLKQNPGW